MDVHEVFDFCQENLDHRFVYVLDVGAALFAWVGAETIDEDRCVCRQRDVRYFSIGCMHAFFLPSPSHGSCGSRGSSLHSLSVVRS